MLEIERKWKIQPIDAVWLTSADISHITQTYLKNTGEERVRRRVRGDTEEYTHTIKKEVKPGIRQESETSITKLEYEKLLETKDPTRTVIQKTRYKLPQDGLTLEIDHFKTPCDFWMLEIEYTSEEGLALDPALPVWVTLVEEVTTNRNWSNAQIALKGVTGS